MLSFKISVSDCTILNEVLHNTIYQPKNGTLRAADKVFYHFVCNIDNRHAIFSTEKGLLYPDTSTFLHGFYVEGYRLPIMDNSIIVGYNGKCFSPCTLKQDMVVSLISFFDESDRSTWTSGGYIRV